MSTLVLTGPAAAGKNAVAAALAALRPRLAIIDVDVVRYMAVQPQKLPAAVADEAEELDWRLGVRAAAALGRAFADADFDVVLTDIVTEESAPLYHELLVGVRIAQLMPAFEEVVRRHRLRGPEPPGSFLRAHALEPGGWRLSEAELERLYHQQEALTDLDVRLDNTALSPEEAADQLSGWL